MGGSTNIMSQSASTTNIGILWLYQYTNGAVKYLLYVSVTDNPTWTMTYPTSSQVTITFKDIETFTNLTSMGDYSLKFSFEPIL